MNPKQILLALPLLCLTVAANCQRTTYSIGLTSGVFNYTGHDAFDMSGVTSYPAVTTRFLGTPGRKAGVAYEVSMNIQRATKSRILFGGELAYQFLQSKTTVTSMSPSLYSSAYIRAEGTAKLNSQFFCVTPFAGYRVLDKKIRMDLTTGLEMAACINRGEDIDAKELMTDAPLTGKNDLAKRPDFRVRLQLNTSMGRFGLTTGYFAGITNYYSEDAFLIARSRFVRLGLSYRLK